MTHVPPFGPLGLRGGTRTQKKPPKGGFFCVRARSPKLRITELASFRLRQRQERRRGQQQRQQQALQEPQQQERRVQQQVPQRQERQQAPLLFCRKRSGQQRRAG